MSGHPAVLDVAVIGVPNDDIGEDVKAVVQLADPAAASPDQANELIEYCWDRIAHFKCPRTIDFAPELPRSATGKLYKRLLRDEYWAGHPDLHRLARLARVFGESWTRLLPWPATLRGSGVTGPTSARMAWSFESPRSTNSAATAPSVLETPFDQSTFCQWCSLQWSKTVRQSGGPRGEQGGGTSRSVQITSERREEESWQDQMPRRRGRSRWPRRRRPLARSPPKALLWHPLRKMMTWTSSPPPTIPLWLMMSLWLRIPLGLTMALCLGMSVWLACCGMACGGRGS